MHQNNKPMFYMHDDLISTMLSFLNGIPAEEFREDLMFYIKWHQVPSVFLSTTLTDSRSWFSVANPMCRYMPYFPRRYLRMRPEDIWSPTLPALISMIDREKVRDVKMYKGCLMRWAHECISNRHIEYWFQLKRKGLSRLSLEHFRNSRPRFFVEEAMREVFSCLL